MRIERLSLHKFVACLTVLGFLFGVTAAGAAQHEKVAKDPKPTEHQSLGTGKYKGLPSFLKTLAASTCTSRCCWASANCAGGSTVCSESGCTASCPDGSTSTYICSATAVPDQPVSSFSAN